MTECELLPANAVKNPISRSPHSRVVLVPGEDGAVVTVRWFYRQPRRWKCGECGHLELATCEHTFAAALLLAQELLGVQPVGGG